MGKISKCYNFNENWYLEDFLPEECDSDKCDLKMAAIAAIMVTILAAIFNMVAKTQSKFRSAPMLQLQRKFDIYGFLEECDRDQCNFKMAVILASIFKMAAKMHKISKWRYDTGDNFCFGLLILYVLMYSSFALFAFHSHLSRCFDMFYTYLRFWYIFMVDVAGVTFVINIVWLAYGV